MNLNKIKNQIRLNPANKVIGPNTIFFVAVLYLIFLGGNKVSYAQAQDEDNYAQFSGKQYCFNSSDGILKYRDEGKGIPLVLLHGVPTSGWLFRNMISELSANGFRVIVPDMLGFGNSDSPGGSDVYSAENHAKRLLELMHSLGIEHWVHAAHGNGALWTNEVIQKAPDKISKLILLNALLNPQAVKWKAQDANNFGAQIGLKLQQWGLKKSSFVSDFIAENSDQKKIRDEVLKGYESPILEGKTKAIFAHYRYMLEGLVTKNEIFRNFKGEIAVIWGEKDEILIWESQKKALSTQVNLDSKNIHFLPSNHLIPEDFPTFIDSVIVDFVFPK